MFFPNYSNAKVRYKSVSISWSVQSFNPRIQIKRNSRILIKKSSLLVQLIQSGILLKINPPAGAFKSDIHILYRYNWYKILGRKIS